MGLVEKQPWTNHSLPEDAWQEGMKGGLSSHLFACSVQWMMREIELAGMSADDVKFDANNCLVTVVWRESKRDTEGASISRTLQCVCYPISALCLSIWVSAGLNAVSKPEILPPEADTMAVCYMDDRAFWSNTSQCALVQINAFPHCRTQRKRSQDTTCCKVFCW